jgi:hypothetical protein
MLKLKTICFATVTLIVLFGSTAVAQLPNPSQSDTDAARRRGPCRDPWITIAIEASSNRRPKGVGDYGECNYLLYNGGSWSNYDELSRAVGVLLRSNLRISLTSLGGDQVRITHDAGDGFVWTQTLKFISDQGSALVGKTRMVSDNGAGLISQTKDFHTLSTTNARVIKLGNSTVVIRKN